MKRLKLIVDVRMYHSSGIGEYIRNTLRGLDHEKIDIGYITSYNIPIELKDKKNYRMKAGIYSPLEQLLLPFIIPSCDLFWTPHYNTPLFWIRAKKRIVTIHDVYHVTPLSDLSFFKKLYARLLMQGALWVSDQVITVSEFSKKEILAYFDCRPGKINVIKNGVRQSVRWKNFNYIKEKYGLPDQFLLFVGSVKSHKNIQGLLKAYMALDDGLRERYKVVIVGKKDGFLTEDKKLFSWMLSQDMLQSKVIFTGFVDGDDLDSVYHYAQLFVFPSFYEGFGLPPLEAMVNECPVIVSNAASMPEICGNAVLYFDPGNPKSIKGKIEVVCQSDANRRELILLGSKWVKNYLWEECYQEHVNVFNELFQSLRL